MLDSSSCTTFPFTFVTSWVGAIGQRTQNVYLITGFTILHCAAVPKNIQLKYHDKRDNEIMSTRSFPFLLLMELASVYGIVLSSLGGNPPIMLHVVSESVYS